MKTHNIIDTIIHKSAAALFRPLRWKRHNRPTAQTPQLPSKSTPPEPDIQYCAFHASMPVRREFKARGVTQSGGAFNILECPKCHKFVAVGTDYRTGSPRVFFRGNCYTPGRAPSLRSIVQLPRAATTALLLAFSLAANAQTTPGQVADAVDDLKRVVLEKFDDDIQKTATGFADAQNIQVSARWADWFRAPLDIAISVLDGLMAIKDAGGITRPASVRTWVKDGLLVANTGHKARELGMAFDRFRQDGAGLALAIDGPSYAATVQEMLDRANSTTFWFNYTAYQNSILNDLTGASGRSPLRIPHKSTRVDREGAGVFNSANDARSYIVAELDGLSADVRQANLPVSRLDDVLLFIKARKTDIINAWTGQTYVSYTALLDKDGTPVQRGVNFSLGTISALNKWRGQMASAFADDSAIEIQMRFVEHASDFVVAETLDDTTEMVNLNLSVKAVLAGGVEANDVLKDATSLGWSIGKPDIGELSDQVRQFASNAREQVNQVPAQMFDAIPGEISKTLVLVDDSTVFARNALTAPFLTSVIIIGQTSVSENSSTVTYIARAGYSDGSYKTITPVWTEDSPIASISTAGVLTVGDVSADTNFRLTATYTEDGITKAAGITVTILNGGFKTLTALSLSAPTSLAEGQSANIVATARFDDGTSQTVSPAMSVSGPASLSGSTLIAGSVSGDSAATLTATFSSGGVTKTATQTITILNVVGPTSSTYELVTDGGFESLTTYWSATGGAGTQIARLSYPHTGTAYASSSINDALGSIHQLIYFPNNTSAATLTLWVSVSSAEPINGNYDLMDVNLRTSGDVLIRKLATYSEADRGTPGVYQKATIDLTPYLNQLRGQVIILQFWFDTDASYVTTFRVDDVSVQAVVPDPKTLTGIVITGPSTIRENTSEQYSIKAEYSDGTEAGLLPSLFGENSPYLSFNASGVLSATAVSTDTAASLFASYSEAGVTRQAYKDVTILNVAPMLTGISINGVSSVDESSTAQFTCTAFFDDYSTQVITPVWSVDSGIASVSAGGQVALGEVSADTLIHLNASYSTGGQTKTASQELLVRNLAIPTTYNVTTAAGAHGTVTPSGTTAATAVSTVVFLASPDVGYEVDAWTVNGTTRQAGGSVFVLGNITGYQSVTVSFKSTTPTFALIVDSGQGTVTHSPDNPFYADGTSVTLTAVPPANNVFQGWSGAVNSALNPVTITMRTNMVVAATFGLPEVRLAPPTFAPDGTVHVLLTGPAGVGFSLLTSTNMTSWESGASGQIPDSGVADVEVAGGPQEPARFYRAVITVP